VTREEHKTDKERDLRFSPASDLLRQSDVVGRGPSDNAIILCLSDNRYKDNVIIQCYFQEQTELIPEFKIKKGIEDKTRYSLRLEWLTSKRPCHTPLSDSLPNESHVL
jgi:hypothetical protein